MRVRIFEVKTETPDGKIWDTYNVAAPTAMLAVKRAKAELFSLNLKERLLSVRLVAEGS